MTAAQRTAGKTIRPPVKRHGGKYYLARRIVALMPEHRVYCEPFLGGGSVLLNKPKADREFAGDLDRGLLSLWLALQDDTGRFLRLLEMLDYTKEIFDWAEQPGEKVFDQAARYIVRNRFSRGGLGKSFAWSDRIRGGKPGDANAWDTIRAELPAIVERVKDVQFLRAPATSLIDKADGPDTLHYLDPPYLHGTRTTPRAYEYEMSPKGHEDLLSTIRGCKGVVMLSGYDSPMYAEALADWSRVTWDLPNHSGQGKSKQRRTECLWMNRPIDREATP